MVFEGLSNQLPQDREPILRLAPRPDDANARGDIFGGWMMAQLDIAGGLLAAQKAQGPVATIAVKELSFLHPLFVYDLVSIYGVISRIGNTSLTIDLEAYAMRAKSAFKETLQVSKAQFIYVAVSAPGTKRAL